MRSTKKRAFIRRISRCAFEHVSRNAARRCQRRSWSDIRWHAVSARTRDKESQETDVDTRADLDVLAVASVELLTNTLANMPEPMRGHGLRALSETLAADVAKKRKRIEQSIPKGSA